MTSVKGLLLDTFGRFALRETIVARVREVGPSLRAIELAGPKLRDVDWVAGDKVQVVLPSLDVRTYTPTRWDDRAGTTEILAFAHGDSPGSSWSRAVKVGDTVRFVGPQRSLRRTKGRTAILFGDETSFGVASALARTEPATLFGVLEVTSHDASAPVLAAIGNGAQLSLVERTGGDAHLATLADQVKVLLAAHAGAELLLTGRAQSIQALQSRLRDGGVRQRNAAKPYWAVGKTGLD